MLFGWFPTPFIARSSSQLIHSSPLQSLLSNSIHASYNNNSNKSFCKMRNGVDLTKDLWSGSIDTCQISGGKPRGDVPVFEIVSRGGFERSQRRIWGRVTERHDTMLADRSPLMGRINYEQLCSCRHGTRSGSRSAILWLELDIPSILSIIPLVFAKINGN